MYPCIFVCMYVSGSIEIGPTGVGLCCKINSKIILSKRTRTTLMAWVFGRSRMLPLTQCHRGSITARFRQASQSCMCHLDFRDLDRAASVVIGQREALRCERKSLSLLDYFVSGMVRCGQVGQVVLYSLTNPACQYLPTHSAISPPSSLSRTEYGGWVPCRCMWHVHYPCVRM